MAWQDGLWESLAAFEAVQVEHRQAFASGDDHQLMARRAEREKALARLQMALAAAHHELQAVQNREAAYRLRAKLSTLLEQEAALMDVTRRVRQQLLDDLAALQRGKRVLKGYSQQHGRSPSPRFLNSRT